MEIRLSDISILSRPSFIQGLSLGNTQGQIDGLVSRFVDEAANPRTLAAIMAGGIAYRLGRVGVMGLRVGAYCNTPLRAASLIVGLGSEVMAFELTNRTLQTVGANLVFAPVDGRSQGSPLQQPNHNLWSWSGPGGWREGLISSAITFGLLKGARHLAREENIVFQHAFQAGAMVTGHQTTGFLGITPRPEGTLAEQILHAEAVNLQLGAGMSLVHGMAPGLMALEWGLDLTPRSQIPPGYRTPQILLSLLRAEGGLRLAPLFQRGVLEMALQGEMEERGRALLDEGKGQKNPIYLMAIAGEGGGGRGASEKEIDTIYRNAPAYAQNFLRLNEGLAKEVHPILRKNRLNLIAQTLAETLNDTNQILTSHHEGMMSHEIDQVLQARNWVRDRFEPFLRDPRDSEFAKFYRQALTSVSLIWIHEDASQIPLSPLRLRVQEKLEKIPDPNPFNENLPWIVREIGKDWGILHRQAYVAIVSFGLERGWSDESETGVDPGLIQAFRDDYQIRYPSGLPPIRPDFLQIFLSTANVVEGLRQKWSTSHPILTGFDYSMEALGKKGDAVFKRYQLIRRMHWLVQDTSGEN